MSERNRTMQDNLPELSVSELSQAVKRTVEDAFSYVRVRGEVSGWRGPHNSGHCYFALKDETARIDAIIWRGTFRKLKIPPEEGMEVIAVGRVSTYQGRSTYQIIIERLEPAGIGALMALLDERRRKLAAEGLFDEARKRPLPYLPCLIAVVTSPTGAVIRDVLHRLQDRFPTDVLVWPVRVQGEGAAAEIATGIEGLNKAMPGGAGQRPDVIIVARGGGSLEDLWCFNEEIVARAAAASGIPLISAVGHETDWTLIDHAADCRAPTPTAAAEMAVPVRTQLVADIADRARRLVGCQLRLVENRRAALRAASRGLPRLADLVALPRQRFDEASGRLPRALIANARAHAMVMARISGRLSRGQLLRRMADCRARVLGLEQRARRAQMGLARERSERLSRSAAGLRRGRLDARIAECRQQVAALSQRGSRAFEAIRRRREERVGGLKSLLEALSHKRVLERGFALVHDAEGRLVRQSKGHAAGSPLEITFAGDDRLPVRVEGQSRSSGRQSSPRPGQKSLFDEE